MRRSLFLFAALLLTCAALIGMAIVRAPLTEAKVMHVGDVATLQGTPPRGASDPVLVELFTSQGCSSCPPADLVLARIAADPSIVAISRNVTYWDRLGWRDSLGRPENTALQQRYAARGVADGEIYTPEAVVNGMIGVVGSRDNAVRRAIDEGARARRVALRVDANRASTPTAAAGAELRFIAIAGLRSVAIGSGENGGRQLRYHNVVLSEAVVACLPAGGCSASMPARIRAQAGADKWAVVLQQANGGPVLAARWMTPAA